MAAPEDDSPLLVASWNVNSIRAREERLLKWLALRKPDVVCLQELKVEDDAFPYEKLRAAGYHSAVFAQRTYNGVAILARTEPQEVQKGMGDEVDDLQARLISACVSGCRVLSAYVPNGAEVGTDKWTYKLDWLKRLRAWLDRACDPKEPLLLCGDFNVAPEARDVVEPQTWEKTVLFHPDARHALSRVTDFGLRDTLRLHTQEGGLYSWWDYRMLAFPRNQGLRIDLILATEPAARACTGASIDRNERKGKQPSDHAPVLAELRGF
jgi:exodeoxyribonuclease III